MTDRQLCGGQESAAATESHQTSSSPWLEVKEAGTLTHDVLFIEDVARILRASRSTIERRRRAGTFPIPELPSIDGRPRWSRQAVERFLTSTNGGARARRGTAHETSASELR